MCNFPVALPPPVPAANAGYATRSQEHAQSVRAFEVYRAFCSDAFEDICRPGFADACQLMMTYVIYRSDVRQPSYLQPGPQVAFAHVPQLPEDLRSMVNTARKNMGNLGGNGDNNYVLDVLRDTKSGKTFYGVYGYPGDTQAGFVFGPNKTIVADISDGDLYMHRC